MLYNELPVKILLEDGSSDDLLHEQKYSILNYFTQNKKIYTCSYNSSHNVLLAEKAIEELSYRLGSDWELYQLKSDQKDFIKSSMFFNQKLIAYYEKKNDHSYMKLSFVSQNDTQTSDTTNITDTFTDSITKKLHK